TAAIIFCVLRSSGTRAPLLCLLRFALFCSARTSGQQLSNRDFISIARSRTMPFFSHFLSCACNLRFCSADKLGDTPSNGISRALSAWSRSAESVPPFGSFGLGISSFIIGFGAAWGLLPASYPRRRACSALRLLPIRVRLYPSPPRH